MHISLVVFRLEVADESPTPEDLFYSAPHFKMEEVDHGESSKEAQAVHTGARQMQKIEIESFELQGDTGESIGDSTQATTRNDPPHKSYVDAVEQGPAAGARVEEPDRGERLTEDMTVESGAAGYSSTSLSSLRDQFRPIDTRNSPINSEEGSSSRPGSARSRPVSHSPSSKVPPTIPFISGNPMVECTEGILHLYKENTMTPLTEDVPRSEMICILAVPTTMTTHDLMQFLGPVYPGVEHIRIIRDRTPNQYMALVKFKNQKFADEFYSVFNNTPFNSLESDICYLVYVARVETVKSSQGACFPLTGMTELPRCPICLTRMEETVEGILTILCNHTFHGLCLTQWGDTSCPVCRYCQTPEVCEDNKCTECGAAESLWICLICGHIGCGRYVMGHAFNHFKETHHTYAMQLSNNRVWDYVGDNYVHRLIQTKGDGKLVEVDEGGNMVQDEKIDSLTLEYTYLLTSQLESQRHYFEEKMEAIERDGKEQKEVLEARSNELIDECASLNAKMGDTIKQKSIFEKRCHLVTTKLTKVTNELEEEKTMNTCLRDNQQQWQDKVTQLESRLDTVETSRQKEVKDLQEQLRDVMFYLEARQQVASTDASTREEIQQGHIVVGTPSPGATGKKTKKKR